MKQEFLKRGFNKKDKLVQKGTTKETSKDTSNTKVKENDNNDKSKNNDAK